jgi:hypothetical protein
MGDFEASAWRLPPQGKANLAVRLLAHAAAIRGEIGAALHPSDRDHIARVAVNVCVTLDEDRFAAIWALASNAALDQLLAEGDA